MSFHDLLGADQISANWDPYLWMALHSNHEDEWVRECCAGADERPRDLADLLTLIPDFWSRAQDARRHLEKMTGRPMRVKLLDFGEPYWFDAGNHASLQTGLADIFEPGRDGNTLRTFLGLPGNLANGESYISGSTLGSEATVRNSVIIGSRIGSPGSSIERAIVINSELGTGSIGAGGVVMECQCLELKVDGPAGFAFRLTGTARVQGDEISAEVGPRVQPTRLSYFDSSKIIDNDAYNTRLHANLMTFAEAAALADQLGPLTMTRLAWTDQGS